MPDKPSAEERSIPAQIREWINRIERPLKEKIAHLEQALRESREEVEGLTKRVHTLHMSMSKRGAGKPFGDQLEEVVNERDALRKQVAELSRPVTDEEWKKHELIVTIATGKKFVKVGMLSWQSLNDLLLSRQPKASQPEEPK